MKLDRRTFLKSFGVTAAGLILGGFENRYAYGTESLDLLKSPIILKGVETSYDDYCNNIKESENSALDSLRICEAVWHNPEGLKSKVEDSGKLVPFFGDTTVITMDEETKEISTFYQKKIIEAVPEVFAEPLDEKYFHITIHDLSNGPVETDDLKSRMEKNKLLCREAFNKLAEYFEKYPEQAVIKVRSTCLLPHATVSIRFIPETERDYRILFNIYNLLEEVLYLEYWLRLHISLCYFKPFPFTEEQMKLLYKVLEKYNKEMDFSVSMDFRKLAYQRFYDMNDYRDVFLVSESI